jgi:hypothetical protein
MAMKMQSKESLAQKKIDRNKAPSAKWKMLIFLLIWPFAGTE